MIECKPRYIRMRVRNVTKHKDGSSTVIVTNDDLDAQLSFDTRDETIQVGMSVAVELHWRKIPWNNSF